MERKKKESKPIRKIQDNKKKKANLEMQKALKRIAKLTSPLEKVAAAGGVIPINLKVGRNFGKSDKVMVSMECCGPMIPPHDKYSSHYSSHWVDHISFLYIDNPEAD